MMKKYYLLLFCVGAVLNVIAAENTTAELASFKEKVNTAIIKFENTDKALWSYTISRHENEEGDISSSLEQHFPQASEPWILKQINGKPPTKKQIKKFTKKKRKLSNSEKQGENIQIPLSKLINPESLSFVSADGKNIIMAFDVYMKKLGKDSVGKLQGKLVYQKENQFIEKITIWNNADFSPMFTANITDLAMNLTFVNINGAILVKQSEMNLKGSFAYFTEINETSIDKYSDYLYQDNGQALKDENNEI